MRKFSLREISKTVLLCTASLNLGLSSDLPWLGFIYAAAFIVLLVRYDASRVPVYRKSIAYGLIVPFAIWWVLSPEKEYGISPWLVFIPAYYLLSLAYLQKRSLGNGGYDIFVLFNGVATLLLSCFSAHPVSLATNLAALLLLVHAYGRPGVKLWKHALFILLLANLGAVSLVGFRYWRSHGQYRAARAADYYARYHLMGFDPAVKLGSFESNYIDKYNRKVVLRVWDSIPPMYMRAAVYEKYAGGVWKLPARRDRMLYASGYKVDYAVFETRDSATSAENSRSVWVQSTLDNFGFFFAPPGAVGVAAKNADSVGYFNSGVFRQGDWHHGDWFYYVPHGNVRIVDDVPDSTYLLISPPLQGFLDTVATEIGLQDSSSDSTVLALRSYFLKNFSYSLRIDGSKSRLSGTGVDPLRVFWDAKSGYCEYFATLSVLLLRRSGVPARYVTGFMHPEISEDGNYAVFRRYSSHAWVEYYSDGLWRPFDPTPPLFVVSMERPSWFTVKFEALSARMARLFHIIRDGEWRLALNSWQDTSQAILSSRWTYVVAATLAFLFFAVRNWRRLGRRKRDDYGMDVWLWVKGLETAEKSLARLGLVRSPGETVGAFLARCESENLAGEKVSRVSPKVQARLQAALRFLREYEEQRWRK